MVRDWPPELENMTAVVAATLGRDGLLARSNAGFRRIAGTGEADPAGTDVSHLFVQPDFAALCRAVDEGAEGAYAGMLTMGDYNGLTRTLHGRVDRCGDGLRLLIEYDVEDLERINEAFRKLNDAHALLRYQLVQANQALQQQNATIEAAALTDPLTGLGNRRHLDATLDIELQRAARTGEPLTAIMADLDHFKNVNDRFGHEAGDQVLKAFGAAMRAQTRAMDLVARFGGEEFVVLLPHTPLEGGRIIAERMRATFAETVVPPLREPVTASFGVAQARGAETAESLLQCVDKALYKAKQSGRNRVVAG